MKEEWKDVEGYCGHYRVSSLGRVKSLKRKKERILKQFNDTRGYPMVGLSNGKVKSIPVHTLVWDAFGSNPRQGHLLQIDHVDENKTNNAIHNLQLLSCRDNVGKSKNRNRKYPIGVRKTKYNRYEAYIKINGVYKHLGSFSTQTEASESYQNALNNIKNQSIKRK